MLPPSHITYTLAVFDLAKKWVPELRKVDYRLVALAARRNVVTHRRAGTTGDHERVREVALGCARSIVRLVVAG